MIRKINSILLVGLLVFSAPIHAQKGNDKIEVFHIEEGKVINEAALSSDIQDEAEKYLANISDVYKKINPFPKKGFIVKIPLQPSILVKNQWIYTLADELTIIFPVEEEPFIMIYDDEHQVYFFTIEHQFNHYYLKKKLGLVNEKR
ncbi:hypothetical protein [Bacillus sp. S/N-304-OC-R1]|uniref:hypothetical protein n=1 Tax=Bacillus sp. S/N-304-OC-R1 TaxID=2758034 RepID=UPI001C8D397C|nr:hypothetical protein [Bacillus sp. S/N-304-OC-R1]MBY0123004.1 hypothetical protein [Bacillus sp. S/N-304-OC-R1]